MEHDPIKRKQIIDQFLLDICKEPEENDVRLIYADWLEENGYEIRAKFIRRQIELDIEIPEHAYDKNLLQRDLLYREFQNSWYSDGFELLSAFSDAPDCIDIKDTVNFLSMGNFNPGGPDHLPYPMYIVRRGFIWLAYGSIGGLMFELPKIAKSQPVEQVRVLLRENQMPQAVQQTATDTVYRWSNYNPIPSRIRSEMIRSSAYSPVHFTLEGDRAEIIQFKTLDDAKQCLQTSILKLALEEAGINRKPRSNKHAE